MNNRVLLLGAGGNAGINFTKSLHMAGYEVYGADLSKYYLDSSNADIKLNIDFSSHQKKLETITEAMSKYDIGMIHAQPDPEVEWLLKNKYHFDGKIFNHSIDYWNKFSNKLACQQAWSSTIKSFTTCSFADAYSYPLLFSEMLYKGQGKVWVRCLKGAGSKAALPVQTMEQASNWASYWREMRGIPETDFMMCQYLPGKEHAVQTFWLNGELIHAQARERVVYFFGALMPSGQTSTPAVAKTVSDKKVYTTAYQAIHSIDPYPHGIYCVDMKEDFEGDPIPTEVNYGRFFTTSDFFSAMGVNTPAAYVQSVLDPTAKQDTLVNYLNPNYYWIRGLDRQPFLKKYE